MLSNVFRIFVCSMPSPGAFNHGWGTRSRPRGLVTSLVAILVLALLIASTSMAWSFIQCLSGYLLWQREPAVLLLLLPLAQYISARGRLYECSLRYYKTNVTEDQERYVLVIISCLEGLLAKITAGAATSQAEERGDAFVTSSQDITASDRQPWSSPCISTC